MASASLEAVHRYHDGTKHHFSHFARSLGYLDWASQPRPFRSFAGAPVFPLYPAPAASAWGYAPRSPAYHDLVNGDVAAQTLGAAVIGDVLRHAMGLSAWKQLGGSRWPLRVNPSSGNLHPTEAYVVCGAAPGLAEAPAVYHYAADRHLLEQRCAFDEGAWTSACGRQSMFLVALTSIHWREAWKYGERAFRYCQHDLGHAIAALGLAAKLAGWRAVLLTDWPHRAIGQLAGLDRDEDFREAEREEPGCLLAITPNEDAVAIGDARQRLVAAVSEGRWSGRASQLSEDHIEWTLIDEIARATEDPGRREGMADGAVRRRLSQRSSARIDARALILKRRSAVAFDGRSTITRSAFLDMLSRVSSGVDAPWNVLPWAPCVHLLIFVHRVDDMTPGLYLLARDPQGLGRLRAACRRLFLWEPAAEEFTLIRLAERDCRSLAARVSCDQAIAGDGFFSLAMIAEFDASLGAHGASFYRHLFWEAGAVGQALYLEAEAIGARATGIGCFYDDPVHEILGLEGHAFQSLYHFSAGMPVEDARLTTEPGYTWEGATPHPSAGDKMSGD